MVEESGVVVLPGVAGATLPGVPDSGTVMLPGAGVILLVLPESGLVVLPGATGVILLGLPDSGVDSGVDVLPGAGVVVSDGAVPGVVFVSEGLVPGIVVVPGVMLSGFVDPGVTLGPGVVLFSGVGLVGLVVEPVLGLPVLTAAPPGQRELSGKYSHRIFMPSGDILISVGALVDELSAWAMEDLLDWAAATLALKAKVRAVPIRLRDFPFILN
ncbi:hypothetical protein NIES2107_03970 [Nostoc carneum NIES-2107]|nr:hypothetical protein NIES2107_03970 [Nostoc carneum NIES-2107]